MAVVGLDDTDSQTGGMCTTWIGTEIVRQLPPGTHLGTSLVRLNPSIEHKTRGNGAVAIRTSAPPSTAWTVATTVIDRWAVTDDPATNPGLVVGPDTLLDDANVHDIAAAALRETLDRSVVESIRDRDDVRMRGWGNGRGRIGATAAIGAVGARLASHHCFRDWTYEWLAYRQRHRWGSTRDVGVPFDRDPAGTWDTVDANTGDPLCVPHTPCPVLVGIRGDDPDVVRRAGNRVTGEPIARAHLFVTNQGTDAHLAPARIDDLQDGHGYRIAGTVSVAPSPFEGGHVRFELERRGTRVPCIAFAPTGRFRDHVRALQIGDGIIACGELGDGTLKLEKFALVRPVLAERVTPTCPGCGCRMKSAGREQGYRCRDCDTSRARKSLSARSRDLKRGWYEVPPAARRHLSAPLARVHTSLPRHPTSG